MGSRCHEMIPTHVGMNRQLQGVTFSVCYDPHARGDEPIGVTGGLVASHDPHVRGDGPLQVSCTALDQI